MTPVSSHTYNQILHSLFAKFHEILYRQSRHIFLESKKCTIGGVFSVFFPRNQENKLSYSNALKKLQPFLENSLFPNSACISNSVFIHALMDSCIPQGLGFKTEKVFGHYIFRRWGENGSFEILANAHCSSTKNTT